MKTAEQRAGDFCVSAGLKRDGAVATGLANILKGYARDQRHLCAEAVSALEVDKDALRATARVQFEDAASGMRADAHAACMNAPLPGE